MKKGFYSVVVASAVLGAASMAFAGAYGEPEQPEEIPAPAPAAPAPEPPAPKILREFNGFLTDAETTRGVWAEIGSIYAAEYHPSSVGNTEAVNTYAHVSYGTDLFEVGMYAPYIYAKQNGVGHEDDFGDLRIWGKVLPFRGENYSAGGGLEISFPTAGSGLGTDEYGFEPFLTAGTWAGPVALRGTIGYMVFTAPDNLPSDAYDYLDYNASALWAAMDNLVVRLEFVGLHLTESEHDPIRLIPGVDYSIPVGENELVLRPTLGIGLTQAPDWELGMGIAFNVANL